jgi:uncharacterized protein YjbI with pentapeptide repeats
MSRLSSRRRAALPALALSLVPLIAPGALRLVPFALLAAGGMLHATPASANADLYCGTNAFTGAPIPCRLKPNTNYDHSQRIGINYDGDDASNSSFRGTNLSNSSLRGVKLIGADLYHAILVNTNFSFANLTNASFTGANMTGANLRNTGTGAITNAQLREASSIQGVNLSGEFRNSQGVPVSANTAGATRVSGNNLSYFDLTNLNLSNANLSVSN